MAGPLGNGSEGGPGGEEGGRGAEGGPGRRGGEGGRGVGVAGAFGFADCLVLIFNHFDFDMCFAPQWRALLRHLNLQKWSEPLVLLTFSLGNVLRATTACTFSTSQLPKVVRR